MERAFLYGEVGHLNLQIEKNTINNFKSAKESISNQFTATNIGSRVCTMDARNATERALNLMEACASTP